MKSALDIKRWCYGGKVGVQSWLYCVFEDKKKTLPIEITDSSLINSNYKHIVTVGSLWASSLGIK